MLEWSIMTFTRNNSFSIKKNAHLLYERNFEKTRSILCINWLLILSTLRYLNQYVQVLINIYNRSLIKLIARFSINRLTSLCFDYRISIHYAHERLITFQIAIYYT